MTLDGCRCSIDFDSSQLGAEQQIWCGQGPQPPNPMVVERFQQVVSQLFQQVSLTAPHWQRLPLQGVEPSNCTWHASCGETAQ